ISFGYVENIIRQNHSLRFEASPSPPLNPHISSILSLLPFLCLQSKPNSLRAMDQHKTNENPPSSHRRQSPLCWWAHTCSRRRCLHFLCR
ncbi:unnamed protein product, partial [Prunus brigantina]